MFLHACRQVLCQLNLIPRSIYFPLLKFVKWSHYTGVQNTTKPNRNLQDILVKDSYQERRQWMDQISIMKGLSLISHRIHNLEEGDHGTAGEPSAAHNSICCESVRCFCLALKMTLPYPVFALWEILLVWQLPLTAISFLLF